MMIRIATYNVLASAYIQPSRYPDTPPELLKPEFRCPAVAAHVVRFDADILCLQEVEETMFSALEDALVSLGYVGALTKKGGAKPDGCAIFVRQAATEWVQLSRVEYDDGLGANQRSGHVAQILILNRGGRPLGVANTHLKWDPPSITGDLRYGNRQIAELLRVRRALAPDCEDWIVCGDFNLTPDNEIIDLMRRAGLRFSHENLPIATCNSNRRAKMIDYIFHSDTIESIPLESTALRDDTPLPSADQPSDHIALLAELRWRDDL